MNKLIKITDDGKTKTSKLMQQMRGKFKVWSYWSDEELDKQFPPPKEATTRYFKEEQESSDFKGKPWNEMDKTDMMTMREYVLFFNEYHTRTGKYADEEGFTLFKDSLPGGKVALGLWDPILGFRQVGFAWDDADYSGSRCGARLAVSLKPDSPVPSDSFPDTLTINGVVYKKQ